MTPLKQTAIRISDELHEQLQRIKKQEGIPISVQVRKALEAWVAVRGVSSKETDRKRVGARKRP